MAKCNSCVHFSVCEKHNAVVDFDVDDGVCLHYEKKLVRCKECIGWCSEEIAKQYGVDRYCTMTGMPTNADDFCSYGEKR